MADHDERFLIRNNGDNAKDFKVSETPIAAPGQENWRDFIDHEAGRPIRNVQAFQDHLVVSYRRQGLPQVRVLEIASGDAHDIEFDEENYRVVGRRKKETIALGDKVKVRVTATDIDRRTIDLEFAK